MKKIHILHILPSADPDGGGVIESAIQIQNELIKMGHQSDIVSCDYKYSKWNKNNIIGVSESRNFISKKYKLRLICINPLCVKVFKPLLLAFLPALLCRRNIPISPSANPVYFTRMK